jgi:hypothetical protein
MMSSFLFALLIAIAPLSDDDVRQRVEAYLGTIDTPITADRWKALGTRGADLLQPIAESSDEFPSRRAKALSALVLASPDRAAPTAAKLAKDPRAPLAVRLAAVRGIAITSSKAQAVRELTPVMEGAAQMHLRAAAAEVIAASGSCEAVKARVSREAEEVRGAYRKALSRCGAP